MLILAVDKGMDFPVNRLTIARTPARAVRMSDTDTEIAKRIPQNGHISDTSVAYLVAEIPAERITGKITAMLEAKTPQGNPDWRAQSDAVKLWMSYVIGLPVQRQHIIQEKITSAPTAQQLLANPVAVEAILRQILADPAGEAAMRQIMGEKALGNGSRD